MILKAVKKKSVRGVHLQMENIYFHLQMHFADTLNNDVELESASHCHHHHHPIRHILYRNSTLPMI